MAGTDQKSPNHTDVSGNRSPIYVLFDPEDVTELDRDHLVRLAAGVLGAVRIRAFGSPEVCAEIMRGLADHPMGAYDEEIVYPRVAKIGPAAYDYYGVASLDDRYWSYAADSAKLRSGLLGGTDPLTLAVDKIRAAWGGQTRPATSGGRLMFAGMIRETTGGMRMHWDEIARELPGCLDDLPISQLGFNWFISMPDGGGETYVYRRRWLPGDEAHREGYGYSEKLVTDEPVAVVRPELGDAILFDPRNYHLVKGGHGDGQRVSLSFFLGICPDGTLIYWS